MLVMLNLSDVLAEAKLEPGKRRYIMRILYIQDSSALCTLITFLVCSEQASSCWHSHSFLTHKHHTPMLSDWSIC